MDLTKELEKSAKTIEETEAEIKDLKARIKELDKIEPQDEKTEKSIQQLKDEKKRLEEKEKQLRDKEIILWELFKTEKEQAIDHVCPGPAPSLRTVDIFDPHEDRTYNVIVDSTGIVPLIKLPFKFNGAGLKGREIESGQHQYFPVEFSSLGSEFLSLPATHHGFVIVYSIPVKALFFFLWLMGSTFSYLTTVGLIFLAQATFEFPLHDVQETQRGLNCLGALNGTSVYSTCQETIQKKSTGTILVVGFTCLAIFLIILMLAVVSLISSCIALKLGDKKKFQVTARLAEFTRKQASQLQRPNTLASNNTSQQQLVQISSV